MKPITKYTLFDYVSSNNLTKLIELADKKDISIRKKNTCLVGRAIEVHAKECFDYLYKKQKDGISIVSNQAYYIAIDNYLFNPTNEHKYYVDKLLELNIIGSNIVSRTINSDELFNLFFERMTKDINKINDLSYHLSKKANFNKFKFVYEWFENNYQTYGLDLNNFKKQCVYYSYTFYHVDLVQFLESKNANILLYYDTNGLSRAYFGKNNNFFDYIIEKYNNLSIEQLNVIPKINNLTEFKLNYELNFSIIIIKKLLNLKKILELPIKFDEASILYCLKGSYENIIKSKYYSEYHLGFIYLVLKKYPNNNNLDSISDDWIKKAHNLVMNNHNIIAYKNSLKKLMCIHMKFSILPVSYSESNILRKIIAEPNFLSDQTKYLEYLEQVLSGKIKMTHYKF
jgi:hypothetical protein